MVIAWKAAPEAARAVTAAMALLSRAKQILIMIVAENEGLSDLSDEEGARLANAFRWHGLNASTRHLQPDARGAAETLLAAASEHAALVVMGAYGHSRLREWVFGGFTQSVLHRRGAGFDDALMKDRGLRSDRSDSQRCLRRSRSHWHSSSSASRRSRARCRSCAR
jgi:nucleotide-binding universal stress UspA family protein